MILGATMALATAAEDEGRSLSIVGAVEEVALAEAGITMTARIDTGATSTSIDARIVEEFERDDEDWVRFEVITGSDESLVMERRVEGRVDIISAGDSEQERLVVNLDLCLGDVLDTVEVNLANRKGLTYRLLVGRDFLIEGGFLVNVAQEKSHAPRCRGLTEE